MSADQLGFANPLPDTVPVMLCENCAVDLADYALTNPNKPTQPPLYLCGLCYDRFLRCVAKPQAKPTPRKKRPMQAASNPNDACDFCTHILRHKVSIEGLPPVYVCHECCAKLKRRYALANKTISITPAPMPVRTTASGKPLSPMPSAWKGR